MARVRKFLCVMKSAKSDATLAEIAWRIRRDQTALAEIISPALGRYLRPPLPLPRCPSCGDRVYSECEVPGKRKLDVGSEASWRLI